MLFQVCRCLVNISSTRSQAVLGTAMSPSQDEKDTGKIIGTANWQLVILIERQELKELQYL
jgi:hypothetical protein